MVDTDYAALVSALRAVPGVANANVEADREGGGLGVLRVALTPGVDEVRVAGDVGRVLQERFGLGVDVDRLQVIEDSTVAVPAPEAAGGRVVLHGLRVASTGMELSVRVSLGRGDLVVQGDCVAAATPSAGNRAVATATLAALGQLVRQPVRFEVEHLQVGMHGTDRVVLVVLSMLTTTGAERLAGTAVVRDDVRQACLRAVLDAVNRRIEPYLTG